MTKLRAIHLFLFVILVLCFKSVSAQYTPSEPAKRIAAILTNSGIEAKTSVSFYQAGVDCHRGTLKTMTYFLRMGGVFFFFNDPLKNCYLALIPIPPPGQPQPAPPITSCIISDSQYEKMFTPWFLDGLKSYDETRKLNAAAQKFIMMVTECMKPISGDELISILPTSKTQNQNANTNLH